MSMITVPAPAAASSRRPCPDIPAEQRIAIRHVPWDIYDRLSDTISEGQNIHLAYDGKDLEIMVVGREHEDFKDLFSRFINAITDDLHVPSRGAGQTTWKRPEILRGLEGDLCYYFRADKLAQDREARKQRARAVASYPNPDLAVEIDMSPSQIDRPSIYQALEVTEVWQFDGASLVIERLGPGPGWRLRPRGIERVSADPCRRSGAVDRRGGFGRLTGLARAPASLDPCRAGAADEGIGQKSWLDLAISPSRSRRGPRSQFRRC